MERIEVPAEVYFKSTDGKKFRLQSECEKWETLFGKWSNPVRYREFENEEGQLCYAFWTETEEEFQEVLWFADHKLHTCTRNHVLSTGILTFTPKWIVVRPFYDGYNSDYEAITMKEYRELLDETLKAVQYILSDVIKMMWEKAE